MDSFMNLAKQGYAAYSESQHNSNVSKTGGQEYNSPDNSGQNQGYDGPQIDHHEAIRNAQQHGTGDSSTFSSAFDYVNQNKHAHNDPVDEDQVADAHDRAYNQGNGGSLDAGSLGSAAALQTLKKFTSGGSGGGGSQTELISMAMAEATKLFDQSGGAASGSKQDAVNGAAMTVMKLLVQSKFGGGMMGGGNSGGLGGIMGLASKFI